MERKGAAASCSDRRRLFLVPPSFSGDEPRERETSRNRVKAHIGSPGSESGRCENEGAMRRSQPICAFAWWRSTPRQLCWRRVSHAPGQPEPHSGSQGEGCERGGDTLRGPGLACRRQVALATPGLDNGAPLFPEGASIPFGMLGFTRAPPRFVRDVCAAAKPTGFPIPGASFPDQHRPGSILEHTGKGCQLSS